MMRDIYSFLLTGFPVFVLFLWACLFLVQFATQSPVYISNLLLDFSARVEVAIGTRDMSPPQIRVSEGHVDHAS
jgi:hypothetical protein